MGVPVPDPIAREVARKRWALPEDLLVPIAALDFHAIERHIGAIERVFGKATKDRTNFVSKLGVSGLGPMDSAGDA